MAPTSVDDGAPDVAARLMGRFEFAVGNRYVPSWEGRIGPMVLKFLLARPGCRATRDLIIDVLWPDVDPRAARARLYAAVSWSSAAVVPRADGTSIGVIVRTSSRCAVGIL